MIFFYSSAMDMQIGSWKTKAILCFFGSAGSPSIKICPDVGSISFTRRFRNVVFPHPVGPTMQRNSPFFYRKRDVIQYKQISKRFCQIFDYYFFFCHIILPHFLLHQLNGLFLHVIVKILLIPYYVDVVNQFYIPS